MNRRQILAGCAAVCVMPGLAQAAAPTRFSVTVSGSGPDVVMIPGLGSSAQVWTASAERLSATHRVHRVQVAGFAGSPPGPNADGPLLAPLVQELGAYIATETTGPVGIVGHSMGGLTAILIAARHPARIMRLLVVDSLPFYGLLGGPGVTVEMMRAQAALLHSQMSAMTRAAFEASVGASAARLALNPAAGDLVSGWSKASDRAVFTKAMAEVMTTDARMDLRSVKARLTVMHPQAADPQQAAQQAQTYRAAYAGVEDLTMIPIANTGHFIMLDQPEVFARHLVAWAA